MINGEHNFITSPLVSLQSHHYQTYEQQTMGKIAPYNKNAIISIKQVIHNAIFLLTLGISLTEKRFQTRWKKSNQISQKRVATSKFYIL